jgi:hypothetical protein
MIEHGIKGAAANCWKSNGFENALKTTLAAVV